MAVAILMMATVFSQDVDLSPPTIAVCPADIVVDNEPPTDPDVTSPSHTVGVWSDDPDVVIEVSGASDNCGVDGFDYAWNQNPSWTPSHTKMVEETWTGGTFTATASGDWYFHLATVDEAGNWTGTVHLGPFKIDLEPPGVPTNLNPPDGTVTNDTTPTLSWDAPSDSGGSGIKNYRYQVDDDPDFSSPLKNGYTSNTYYSPRLTDGTYYWRVRARDNAGNNGAWTSGQQIIIDTEPPQITCPGDITQGNDPGQCSAAVTWTAPTATDNVGVEDVRCDPPSGSSFPVGTTVVTCTATDFAGNTAECSFTVTVVDNEPPTDPNITSPSHTVGVWSNDPDVVIEVSGASDNCGVDGFEYAWDQNPSWTPSHTKMVEETWTGGTFTATASGDWYFHLATVDEAGNWTGTVHLGPFKIDLDPPGVPGNLSPADGTVTNDTTPTLSWDAPSDSGGSGIKNYRYQVDDEPSFSSPWVKNGYTTNTYYTPNLAEGTYYWRVRARDNAGNNGAWTSGQQIIIDTEPPEITCPGDITQGNDPGQCSAAVTWTAPTASDNVGVASVSCDPPSGSRFPVGVTTVACTATDLAGNVTTCSFEVTVNDVEPPTTFFLVTPPDPDNDPTPHFTWEATDNNGCTATNDLLFSTRLDGGRWSEWSPGTSATIGPLSEGLHTFQVRAKDEAGNVEATASYTWLVDLTPPAITIMVPEDGANYVLNEEVLAEWWAVDELSGLIYAEGTVDSGDPIDTHNPGWHDFIVTAADSAGNISAVTLTYQVVYAISPGGIAGGGGALGEGGVRFLDKSIAGGGGMVGIAPLAAVYRVGELIHVSFTLTDVEGNIIADATATCTLVRVTIAEDGEESYSVLNLWPFGFDKETGLYFLDIETADLAPGIYDLWLGFGDGTHTRLRIVLEEPRK